MKKLAINTFLAASLLIFAFSFLACSSSDMQQLTAGDESDGDKDSSYIPDMQEDGDSATASDGDLEKLGETDDDLEIGDNDSAESKDGDSDPEADFDSESPVDGDQEENPDGDQDLDTDSDPDSEAIGEQEIEPESEIEPEPELEPIPLCTAESNPLDFWTEEATPLFSVDPWAFEGEISEECQTDGFLIAGAKGMRVKINLDPREISDALVGRLTVNDVASASGRREGTKYFDESDDFPINGTDFEFTLPYSGEYLLTVSGRDYDYYGKYTLSAQCLENCGTRFTRFPIVLMHGMGGFDSALFNLLTYFSGVEEDLDNMGYYVDATVVSSFNDSIVRATQVEEQLMAILTDTGARKIDIVAHSQGGLDARHFISVMGHAADVAVLAMVATPNKGSVVGDIILGNVGGYSQDVIAGLVDFFAELLGSDESDLEGALEFISMKYMTEEFNPTHPDAPGVRYWSWAGVSCGMFDSECRSQHANERVSTFLALTYGLILDGDPAEGHGPNDGMVMLDSATYGEFQGIVNADHADEIGQVATYSDDFHHLDLYRTIANKLYTEGY